MIRASWKGHLRLSLVSVPVQAISANVVGGGEVHFHQLHERCHSRIKYKKICPLHGEVSNDEIVSGYEYAKGKYVVIDPEELDSLAADGDRVINIETFVAPGAIDPLYFDGRSFYLVPDGAAGQKPYAVLCQAMEKQSRFAVAQCAFSRRTQLVLVRPLEDVLIMSVLKYAAQLRPLKTIQDEIAGPQVAGAELKLAQTLISASSTKSFNIAKYEDNYTDQLTELIQAKVAGKEVVAAPTSEPPPTINLMDALRKSVGTKKSGTAARSLKPPKKLTVDRRRVAPPARRKSS